MSDYALTTVHFSRPAGLRLRLARLLGTGAPPSPVEELQKLSDHLLVDIGVDPRDIARPAHEEAVRLELLDRGWHRPGGPKRA